MDMYYVTLNGIENFQALTVDSHPLDITHALVQDSPLGYYLLCEQHKVQHTTSIVSISTYAVTYACSELFEGILNSDGTGPEIEFHEWTWLIGWICSLRAFSISAGILIASLPFSIPELVNDGDGTSTVLQDSGRPIRRNLHFNGV
jgi:hypothetical protein